METTVVDVSESKTESSEELFTTGSGSSVIRDVEFSKRLQGALDYFMRVLREEPKDRLTHSQLSNSFKVCTQYLETNTLDGVKNLNLNMVRESITFIDKVLAGLLTTASIHEQIIEVVSAFIADFKEVSSKVETPQ